MNDIMLKKLGITVTAVGLCMVVNASHAAALVPFTNGSIADADDVNANFTELETRITNISLTPGPTGATGPAGADGIDGINGTNGANGIDGAAGADGINGTNGTNGIDGAAGADGINGTNGTDGAGVVTHSWADANSGAWNIKAYIVTHSASTYDKEIHTFDRSFSSPGVGTNDLTRQRKSGATVVKHQILHFTIDTTADLTLNGIDTYLTDTTTLINTKTLTPGFVFRHAAMGEGMTWADAAQVTRVNADASPTAVDFGTNSQTFLGLEDITVQSVAYTGCQKILRNRSAHSFGRVFQSISWYCPNGVGLVKRIVTDELSGPPGESRMLEFAPTDPDSEAVPPS